MPEQPDLMRVSTLAAEWDLAEGTLDNWRSRGIGPPYIKLGGVVRYSRKACQQWLAGRQVNVA